MRILAFILSGIFAVFAVLVLAVFLLDWNMFKDEVADFAGGVLGREVRIGALHGDPGWTTRIRLEDVAVANADWADPDDFVKIGELDFAIRVWPLVSGKTNLPYVRVDGAEIDLVRRADGTGNWDFDALGDAAGRGVTPDDRGDAPVIGQLEVENSAIRFRDRGSDTDVKGQIRLAEGASPRENGLSLDLKGRLGKSPLEIEFRGGPVALLRDTGTPYPVDLKVSADDTRASVQGTVSDFQEIDGLTLDVRVSGPDLGSLLPSLDLPLPNTPPYELSGHLTRAGGDWAIRGLNGTLGDTDIAGDLRVELDGDRPKITGKLVSDTLDFDDIRPLIGLRADPAETARPPEKAPPAAARKGLFPDVPLDEERLETADADLTYTARSISAENLPLTAATAHIVLNDKRLSIRDMDIAIAGGRVHGEIALNARQTVPSADISLGFERLDLKPFFRDTQFVQETGGSFSGNLYMLGTGRTLEDVMATGRGGGAVAIEQGSISALIVEGAGLDLIEALVVFVGEDTGVPIRCGRIDVEIDKGIATATRAVIDTTDSTLVSKGKVDLGSQTVDLQIEARAKDFSLIDSASPVTVRGRLSDPEIGIGKVDWLPFFETGDQENVNCTALLRGVSDRRRQE